MSRFALKASLSSIDAKHKFDFFSGKKKLYSFKKKEKKVTHIHHFPYFFTR